jgi:hypothetical protein
MHSPHPSGRKPAPRASRRARTRRRRRRALLRLALTEQDAIVFPQTAQTLPGVDAQVFSGIGHLQLCTDARVFAWVAAQLHAPENP